jgi:cytochrome c-type biogenesis protein CcmH
MSERVSRRAFLGAVGLGAASGWLAAAAAPLGAQDAGQPTQSSASNVVMDGSAYRPVVRAAKPGARAVVTKEQMEAFEHTIGCACPCTLDVFTCRTTDFSCGISPAMHRDVVQLIDGGYTVDEIRAAFVDTYGEQVLMAPTKHGFNLAGYVAPFAALGTGAIVVAALIRKWGARAAAASAAAGPAPVIAVDATPDELARLDAAVRGDEP